MIDLSGLWHVRLNGNKEYTKVLGNINLPGIIQTQGFGEVITQRTEMMSGLHNPFWYERKEYSFAQEDGTYLPYLAQPCLAYSGEAVFERTFCTNEREEWILSLEITRWKVKVSVDNEPKGEIISLFAPFDFNLGILEAGEHTLTVSVDNSLQYPYRPDGHGVSDALGATWNGIGGELCILNKAEYEKRIQKRQTYAIEHKRSIQVKNGKFVVDGIETYFRGTHFGGDYPHTGIPETDRKFWDKMMNTVKEWGFNFIRCHSYCPPDIAFTAADEAGVFLLIECGMWNTFNQGSKMLDVLYSETERILTAFGHHPSFVMFSPSNEPGGDWYKVLREWTDFARMIDDRLGYSGRRLYTAESGWFYDVAPSEIEGTDFLYFHRSNFGPYPGGMIRNDKGWNGKDYSCSLTDSKLPVICHEMGQWCSYPDFDIIDKFSGYMVPGHYRVFKKLAEAYGLLPYNKDFVYCSGRNQLRMLKEDFEANYRTDHLYGYEYLDLHDYLGQGGAFVGLLDAFWDNKGYTTPEEFREICSDTIVLTRLGTYVYKNDETIVTPIEVCHFGKDHLTDVEIVWSFESKDGKTKYSEGSFSSDTVHRGDKKAVGKISINLKNVKKSSLCVLKVSLINNNVKVSENHWDITVFAYETETETSDVVVTKLFDEAKAALLEGKKVIYSPYLSDLDFDCPAYSIKNSFWNNQMGPTWVRPLGISVNEKHPALKSFPTEHSGGWQWEDILGRARMLKLDAKYDNIVRGIDEWNRSFPLSLIFEAQVGKGKLLVVTADLSGTYEERPAAYTLRNSILSYVSSEEFNPLQKIDPEIIEKHILPLWKGVDIVEKVVTDDDSNSAEKENREDNPGHVLLDLNPNLAYFVKGVDFPFCIDITLNKKVCFTGICCLPPQGDRDFLGVVRDYALYEVDESGNRKEILSGTFENSYEMQRSTKCDVFTDHVVFEIRSVYGTGTTARWDENRDGWFKTIEQEPGYVQIAGLQIMYEGESIVEHNNNRFWTNRPKSVKKEIES